LNSGKDLEVMGEIEEEKGEERNISLPIEWDVPTNIQSRYATNIVVQASQHEFVLSFFEAQLPIFLGLPEEKKNHLEQVGKVHAVCVGRIIVAADRFQDFVDAMQITLNDYIAHRPGK
jgi:hypothetical protein